MSPEQKIWRLSEVVSQSTLPSDDQVVLCYGHFNIIHPGHIRYLEHAKSLGKRLIVAVQGDQMLTHSGNSHLFSEQERALGLAWLQIVDVVLVLDSGDLAEAIRWLRPSLLVLGKEFEKDQHGLLKESLKMIREVLGKVVYHAGEIHYATSELLREEPRDVPYERWEQFQQACQRQQLDLQQLQQALDRFQQSRLLVLGDTIVDQYIACDALGMSAEAPVLVVRELKAREYLGGAAIVVAHAQALGAQCAYLSVVGQDQNAQLVQQQLGRYGVSHSLIPDPSRPTTFKIRYMVENQKLFRVSRLQEHSLSEEIETQVVSRLRELAPQLDGILVSDFVYGVITENILTVLQELKNQYGLQLFGDLQCSSQVGNVGKFRNFDLMAPTEKEARIALGSRDDGIEWVANQLMQQSQAKHLLIKLGADGFIAYTTEEDGFVNRQHFPALCPNPVDVAGAGDSLSACMAVSLCAGNSPMISAALGACMASLSVGTVGNLPVRQERIRHLLIKQFSKNVIQNSA
jgi:rfaE bifunctional protein kinase chain/domain